MLNWLLGPKSGSLDLSFLGMDLHSHLLPGLDDGVQTVEEAVAVIRRLGSFGCRHLVTTPHVLWDCYRNTPDMIQASLETVRSACRDRGVEVTIAAAAEYFLDEHFNDMLRAGKPLLSIGNKRVLVEFPYTSPLLNYSETLFSIIEQGYRPVLAHPERYAYFFKDLSVFRQLRSQGCELQLNALSLTGHYGPEVNRVAKWLLSENLINYLGTDAHHMHHLDKLEELSKLRSIRSYPFDNAKLLPDRA